MKKVVLIVVLLFPLFVSAQSKKFREDFNDNKAKWILGETDDFITKIEDGFLVIEAKMEDKQQSNPFMINGKIELNKEFDIETRIKLLSSEGTQNSYGICVGHRDKGNSHYLVVSQEQKMAWWYQMSSWRNTVVKNEPLLITTFKSDDPVSGTKLFMKFRDGNLYFFVNDVYVTKVPRPTHWLGNGIGIFVSPGMKVKVDYIDLKQY